MLRALLERKTRPSVIVGTSIGAINGAIVAKTPSLGAIDDLLEAWMSPEAASVYGDSFLYQFSRLIRTRTHMNSPAPLRRMLERILGAEADFGDLSVPLRVVAASIERAAEQVFDSGPLIQAVLASASVPGLLPPTRINGETYIDGGVVNSIPISPAVETGATTIFVLQVGRVEKPLRPPRTAVQTAQVAFEVARRHRYARDIATLPEGISLHVLPIGGALEGDDSLMSYRRMDTVRTRIELAYEASTSYLDDHFPSPASPR
ncbi:patatin-like phospholipase family protein [Microbacterium lacus]|uniref:patatin-like phospholipase family protein n=1 Tax=Microbacterium lacus TaxID=415217 RepID=UPI00384EA200